MSLGSRSRDVRSALGIARCDPTEWTSKEMRLPADRYMESGRFLERRWSDADQVTRSVSEGVSASLKHCFINVLLVVGPVSSRSGSRCW